MSWLKHEHASERIHSITIKRRPMIIIKTFTNRLNVSTYGIPFNAQLFRIGIRIIILVTRFVKSPISAEKVYNLNKISIPKCRNGVHNR